MLGKQRQQTLLKPQLKLSMRSPITQHFIVTPFTHLKVYKKYLQIDFGGVLNLSSPNFTCYRHVKLPGNLEENKKPPGQQAAWRLVYEFPRKYFHIQRGASVPISASQFYAGLKQRFAERDGMYFLAEQVAEYEKARSQIQKVEQLSIFVTDEKSAILWARNELEQYHQSFGELMPNFMKNGQPQRHEKMPDLQKILDQNFLKDEDGRWYVPDINRQADLEKLRDKDLLREFDEYKDIKGKIKVFRSEAVRTGFKQAWGAKDFATIVAVAKKLPEAVLQEDQALLMYYDNARIRLED